MKILHISDIHVSPDHHRAFWHGGWRHSLAQVELRLFGRAQRFRDAADALSRVRDAVRAHGVDHVVLSGDLTAVALEEEFEAAREALGELVHDPERITVIPGNHDRFTPESRRRRHFERFFGDLLRSELPEYQVHGRFPFVRFVGRRGAVVGLDSALVPLFPGLAYGRVGRRQLEALRRLLADVRMAGRTVLVTLHHAPYGPHGRPERWTHGLRDADALLSLCAEMGVAGVLHGHVHHRYRLRSPGHDVEVFGAGSSTEAGNEGYWLLEAGAGRVLRAESWGLELPLLPAAAAA